MFRREVVRSYGTQELLARLGLQGRLSDDLGRGMQTRRFLYYCSLCTRAALEQARTDGRFHGTVPTAYVGWYELSRVNQQLWGG